MYVARVVAISDVGRAVGQMTEPQRARLGVLLAELDAAEAHLIEAERVSARAQVDLAAARAAKQRRLDAIESLVEAVASATR